jgi:hypothetical protein
MPTLKAQKAQAGSSWSDDARTALEVAPEYFLGWYTVKSLALVAVFGALCYQLGKSHAQPGSAGAPAGGVRTGDDGGAGPPRTDADVRALDAMIQSYVDMLENALMGDAIAKYGTDGFAATISAQVLPQFQADRDFYRQWRTLADAWAPEHQLVQDTTYFVAPDDTYRRFESYLPNLRWYLDTAKSRGLDVDGSGLAQPSA